MKEIFLLFILINISVGLYAQNESKPKPKHEITAIMIDGELLINTQNTKSKFVIGTGLLYAYQLNDIIQVQAGYSNYETLVDDDCELCFFGGSDGQGAYHKKEFRLGLGFDRVLGKKGKYDWHMATILNYNAITYYGIFEATNFDFNGPGSTNIVDVNQTSRYIGTGIDVGIKYKYHPNIAIGAFSNLTVAHGFATDNITSVTEPERKVLANVLELRIGIKF